jgi:hypothetical protein
MLTGNVNSMANLYIIMPGLLKRDQSWQFKKSQNDKYIKNITLPGHYIII